MEELEVMLEEGDFEVVDECTGEEDTSPVTMQADEQKDVAEKQVDPPSETTSAQENSNDQQMDVEIEAIPSTPMVSSGNPEPTTNVAGDQSGTLKRDAAEDDAIHLDVSDVVFLESVDGVTNTEAKNSDNGKDTDSVVEIIPPEHAWYEEKLNSKMTIVKERLSKLARVLELSYPTYKPWLEHNKTSICHLDPPRRCPLDKPYTNRWKFICSRKTVQETTNEEEDSAEGTVNKKLKTVWRLGPTDGSGDSTDNASQYPPFVMRVVKVFEEFIQSVEQTLDEDPAVDQETTEESKPIVDQKLSKVGSNEEKPSEVGSNEGKSSEVGPNEVSVKEEPYTSIEEVKVDDDVSDETNNEDSGCTGDRSDNWFWLLVRSNSKDELMVFATGKKIRESTMQKLKQTFETGAGKDCNVKSLYCKSIDSKGGNAASSNKTFLAGTEALDETVSGIKIQLAPKTNFWCNASGVEQLGTAVGDMLSPLQKTTVIEVGCGLGLLGLMVAPKCKKVIGLDAPSEVEEAEMTRELNKVQNASFIMGQSNELMTKVKTFLKNTRAAAIVNGNTKLGRDIEVMTALRQIPSLRRVVIITTLTKQSVRAMLELIRPSETDLGNPFMPLRAMLVDTLPAGPHFEVVIRMERLNLEKINEPWFWDHVKFRAGLSPNELPRKNPLGKMKGDKQTVQAKKGGIKSSPGSNNQIIPNSNRRSKQSIRANKRNKMRKRKSAVQEIVLGTVTGVVRNPLANIGKKATVNLVKNPMALSAKAGKPSQKPTNLNNAKNSANVKTDVSQSSVKTTEESPASPDPLNPVKVAKSTKVWNTALKKNPIVKNPMAKVQAPGRGHRLSGAQKRKRHWAMLEAQRRSGIVGNMNDQGPVEKRMRGNVNQNDLRDRLLEGRIIQQIDEQQMLLNIAQQRMTSPLAIVDNDAAKQLQSMLNIVIDQTNKLQNQFPRSVWDRIAPPGNNQSQIPDRPPNPNMFRDRFVQDVGPQDIVVTTQNRTFGGNPQPLPLFNRPSVNRANVMPAGMSGHENRVGHQVPRGISQHLQGGDYKKNQGSNWSSPNEIQKNRPESMNKNSTIPSLMEPVARPPSPKRSLLSTPVTAVSLGKRYGSSSFSQQDNRRQQSPPQSCRQSSPSRSEIASTTRNNPYADIFQRRSSVPQGRQQQQQNSDFTRRGNSSSTREQAPNIRSLSPNRGVTNDWKMDNRGTMEQGNWNQRQQGQIQQQRSIDRNTAEDRWSNDRPQNTHNWDNSTSNDGFRSTHEKQGGERKDGLWMSGGGDIWNSKQISVKPTGMEMQWESGNDRQGPSSDNWNSRGNGNYNQMNNRMDNWRNPGKNEKDWTNMSDNAKDSWNDGKSRWQQTAKSSNSNWGGDEKNSQNWGNKSTGNNWQNRGAMSMNVSKPLWPNMSNQNNSEQRWMPQNETNKSGNSGNWQGNNYGANNWRPQNFSGFTQQQRQNNFGTSNFKGGC